MNYSGFWRRFLAMILDSLFIWIICMVLILPYFLTPLCLIIAGFYHVVFETSALRATPGKALLNMAVIKTNGQALTIKDSIIRFVVTFISSALLCLGYLISLFTEKRQTLHDLIADTIVVNERFAENNFWQIFLSQSKIIFSSESHPSSGASYENKISAESLEDLYNLYQKGILTEEEYKAKKEEYLKRL